MQFAETERERIAVAFHEAGHAVAGALSGARIVCCVLTDDPAAPGRTEYAELPEHAETGGNLRRPFAEARHSPALADIGAALSGTCDGDELAELGGGLARDIEPLLSAAWPAVRALAADLFRDGHAGHGDVLRALGATSDDDLPIIRSLIKAKVWTPPTAA
ncbi:hypothetical protein G4H71_18315 [Rhodococcus triatomae]|uniref:Peptidase family M41 n=1 Tax=Rhodococcus triatomae TaxID=300028 RepID=A0A1G8F0U3_9NOCA|nr:hypothetical protein [Rhodococcus triatomae]QNG19348.1 hypothetical protein G4H72_12060 [Rhodococcus triatomae]QNG24739.1 hypothetical protein G4H71_18315 [Rhodococcus triatomae]SDH75629.1 hypothetical protein SAMN05444695_103125 [Rhodococcus triatomae]